MAAKSIQRTTAVLRERGWPYQIVERHFNGLTYDMFGFIDLVTISPGGIIGIQACSPGTHQEHKRKILENENAPDWAKWAKIEIWTWRKLQIKPHSKKLKWQPHIEEITNNMFDTPPHQA